MAAVAALCAGALLVAGMPAKAAPATPVSGLARGPAGSAPDPISFWTGQRALRAVPVERPVGPGATTTGSDLRSAAPSAGPRAVGAVANPSRGEPWTAGGAVTKTVGTLLLVIGGISTRCSSALVQDPVVHRSIVLTAAHCAFDPQTRAFVTNVVFVPGFDPDDVRDQARPVCEQVKYGCWPAQAMTVHKKWVKGKEGNSEAALHDWAFVALGLGGPKGDQSTDEVLGAGQAIDLTGRFPAIGSSVTLFGYPENAPFDAGALRLIYCRGGLGLDRFTRNRTFSVSCLMRGGSSGGPLLTGFDDRTGTGVVIGVLAYGYLSAPAGEEQSYSVPLNAQARVVFKAALTARANEIVS